AAGQDAHPHRLDETIRRDADESRLPGTLPVFLTTTRNSPTPIAAQRQTVGDGGGRHAGNRSCKTQRFVEIRDELRVGLDRVVSRIDAHRDEAFRPEAEIDVEDLEETPNQQS